MNELLQMKTITVTEPLSDVAEECTINGDYLLPEYCPDVAVVLKCMITPQIQTRRPSGDTFAVEGVAVVRVLYLDEERTCVREAEFTQPIHCALRVPDGCEGIPIRVWVMQDYVNCRAVSSRRIEVRSGFTMHARAQRVCSLELPCESAVKRLHTKEQSEAVSRHCAAGEKMLTVNETLAFDSSRPSAEQLLGGECTAAVTEVKLLTDKAIVKGCLYLHQLYASDVVNGSTAVLDFTIPFSAIMDVEGVRSGQQYTAYVSVLSDTEECVAGEGGMSSSLLFTAKLLVQLHTYEKETVTLITDAYHCDCPVSVDRERLLLQALEDTLCQTVTMQKELALPDEHLREILDVWLMPLTPQGEVQSGHAQFRVPMVVSMLARNVDGAVVYYEQVEDFTTECALSLRGDAEVSLQATASVIGINYAALGDKLDLRVTVSLSCEWWRKTQADVVRELTLQEECAFADDGATMRLYYAQSGESVWDIARHCHTSPNAVREENNLHDDVLSVKTVLLIPTD